MLLVRCLLKKYYLLLNFMKCHDRDCSPLVVMIQMLIELSGINKANKSQLYWKKRKGLVNISTCNLHLSHNAFQKGLQVFGGSLFELAISLHIWLRPFASRREEYEEVQWQHGVPAGKFLKQVESRWLRLAPVLLLIVEQLDDLKQYFSVDIPAKESSILHYETYKKISDQIRRKYILGQIHFVGYIHSCWYIQPISCVFTQGWTVNEYITLRVGVTSVCNNVKISKARGVWRVGCKRVARYQNCKL